jgi:hypothetical protein
VGVNDLQIRDKVVFETCLNSSWPAVSRTSTSVSSSSMTHCFRYKSGGGDVQERTGT